MTPAYISEVVTLGSLISDLASYPDHTWVYASGDFLDSVELDLECHLCVLNSRDFTDAENDQREQDLEDDGLGALFSKQQLEDILTNLRLRKDLGDSDIARAVDYYVFHDAFLPEKPIKGEQVGAGNPLDAQ